jgi:ureidoacrylate peracid hydrolase
MEKVTYNKQLTALLVIDPYNDFISEGGKVWDRLKAVAEANNSVPPSDHFGRHTDYQVSI